MIELDELQGWPSRNRGFRARALCALCIHVSDGSQVVSPSGYDAMTVPCKQEVIVPREARGTARHLEVLARRSQHRGAPAVRTWESELLSSLACLQCRVMPCITGAAGAQRFRRPVQQEHWTCPGGLRACAAGPAQRVLQAARLRSLCLTALELGDATYISARAATSSLQLRPSRRLPDKAATVKCSTHFMPFLVVHPVS